ncbi:MAG: hypothetical protein H0V88_11280 [Pyrinomonadaceae bacterium]|nr:hypothetical protein [Pyrinomonadaceae bacterium]
MRKLIFNFFRLLLLLLVVVAASFFNAAFAQSVNTENRVAAIRKHYAETNERISAGLEDHTSGLHHAMYSVGGERDGMQWRAVGTMTIRAEFFFNCEPGDKEECGTDPRKFLGKIVTSYRGAADLLSNNEYLFNDAGELVFVLDKGNMSGDDGKIVERRYYFANNNLIRVMHDAQIFDRNFTVEDQTGARESQAEAKKLRNLFAMMVDM